MCIIRRCGNGNILQIVQAGRNCGGLFGPHAARHPADMLVDIGVDLLDGHHVILIVIRVAAQGPQKVIGEQPVFLFRVGVADLPGCRRADGDDILGGQLDVFDLDQGRTSAFCEHLLGSCGRAAEAGIEKHIGLIRIEFNIHPLLMQIAAIENVFQPRKMIA